MSSRKWCNKTETTEINKSISISFFSESRQPNARKSLPSQTSRKVFANTVTAALAMKDGNPKFEKNSSEMNALSHKS